MIVWVGTAFLSTYYVYSTMTYFETFITRCESMDVGKGKKLLAMDLQALAAMKNAAKREMQCELQSS